MTNHTPTQTNQTARTLLQGFASQYQQGMMSARWVLVNAQGEVLPNRDKHGRANRVLYEKRHSAIRNAKMAGAFVYDLENGTTLTPCP